MADDLWGAAVGGRVGQQDLLNSALGLSNIDLQAAHTRYYGAESQKLESEAAQNQQLVNIMLQQAAGQPQVPGEPAVSAADRLDALTQSALDAGLVTKSQELAKTASLVRSREATALSAGASAAVNRVKLVRDRAELTGQIFGGATDQATWDRTHQLWEFQTGERSPYAGMAYSKELVDRINSTALSTKERADIEEKRLTAVALADFRKRRLSQIDTENDIRNARLTLARARETRLAKAGGGRAVTSPGTAEIDQARRLIGRDYENLDPKDSQDAAYSVAAEARALRRANPALDSNVALQQAYNNAKAAGDFQVLSTGLFGFGKKSGFSGAGKTPETAATLPKDSTTLQKDRYYLSPTGVLGKWNGKTFELIVGGARRPLSPGNGRPAGDTGDTTDDEED